MRFEGVLLTQADEAETNGEHTGMTGYGNCIGCRFELWLSIFGQAGCNQSAQRASTQRRGGGVGYGSHLARRELDCSSPKDKLYSISPAVIVVVCVLKSINVQSC